MKKLILMIAGFLVFGSASAQIPVVGGPLVPVEEQLAQDELHAAIVATNGRVKGIKTANTLLSSPDLQKARLAECQPEKFDRVMVKEIRQQSGGALAAITILSGGCISTKTVAGWISTNNLFDGSSAGF